MRTATLIAHIEHILANHAGKQCVMIGGAALREVIRELKTLPGKHHLAGLRESLRISERILPRHSNATLNELARKSFHDNARSYCVGAAETQQAIIDNIQDRIIDAVKPTGDTHAFQDSATQTSPR